MAKLKTVSELIEALKAFPADMPVGIYLEEAEDGGAGITKLVVQKADDETTQLYHKGDSPVGRHGSLKEMLTICSHI